MCIIISKPAGIELPSITAFRNCWERNPHGAGFAVAYKGRVHIRKGFMAWDEFIDSINFDRLVDYSCVFHFRYATHGSKTAGNCHPFPVSGNLRRLAARTDVAVFHNGVIHNVQITKKDYSDTMTYIDSVISPFWVWCKEKGCRYMFTCKNNQDYLINETGSKWTFLFADGKIVNVGDGVSDNGLWYSNSGFKKAESQAKRVSAAVTTSLDNLQLALHRMNSGYYV